MHLVGYLYEDYHDARSLEQKIGRHIFGKEHFYSETNVCG
jgi:hypothetical protein